MGFAAAFAAGLASASAPNIALGLLAALALAMVPMGILLAVGVAGTATGLRKIGTGPMLLGDVAFLIWLARTLAARQFDRPVLGVGFAFALAVGITLMRSRVTVGRVVAATALTAFVGFAVVEIIKSRLGLNPTSGDYRFPTLESALTVVEDSPIWGTGWARVGGPTLGVNRFPQLETIPHNLFVGILLFAGTPTLLAFCWFLWQALNTLARFSRAPNRDDAIRRIDADSRSSSCTQASA